MPPGRTWWWSAAWPSGAVASKASHHSPLPERGVTFSRRRRFMAETKDAPAVRTRVRHPVPREGEGGLYTQSWFPVCRSDEVPPGTVIGRPFLGGRIIVWRGMDSIARVAGAYCLHVGADR